MVTKKWFEEKYGDGMVFEIHSSDPPKELKRYAAVLPLELEISTPQGSVIPIPMIVHTGAPKSLYLGSQAWQILSKMRVLMTRRPSKFSLGSEYHLLGKLTCGDYFIQDVDVDPVPMQYEGYQSEIRGDIRCNMIGAPAIAKLNQNEVN